MKAQLLVSQSVSHSKTPDRIFIKLPMKFWCLKDKKMPQPGKNIIWWKILKYHQKYCFLELQKTHSLMCYFWVYMIHHICLYESAKTACFGKIPFPSYKQKCSRPMRLQKFLNFNISKTTWGRKCVFCM